MQREEILDKAKAYIGAEKNEHFRSQVEGLVAKDDIDELNERFYQNLAFGTGGLRGIIGGGYNRMNTYTVAKATQGLAEYLLSQNIDNPSVAIAFDSRNFADVFAEVAATVYV